MEYHLARDAADCEIPHQTKFVVDVTPLHHPAVERYGREVRRIKEVDRPEVRIALLLARVDTGDLDCDIHQDCPRVGLIHPNCSLYIAEGAFDTRDHEVPNGKLHM
jgi:hypothetical protein